MSRPILRHAFAQSTEVKSKAVGVECALISPGGGGGGIQAGDGGTTFISSGPQEI